MRCYHFFTKYFSFGYRSPMEVDEDTEDAGRILPDKEYVRKVSNRRDIFFPPKAGLIYCSLAVCLIIAGILGIWLSNHEIITVASDFYERSAAMPRKKVVKSPLTTVTVRKKQVTPLPENVKLPVNAGESTGGGDPRARVTKKGVLGIVSGNVKGKTVAAADIFGKGGFAEGIDAVLNGAGGLKAGGSSGTGRKGAAGIGYGAGYGSGFGGGSGGVDNMVAGMSMKKRGSLKIATPKFIKGGALAYQMPSQPYDAQGQQWNTEAYDVINENEFKEVVQEPLSTFSIDVDAASYSNIRRFINYNQLPPKDAVRIEEMINYFTYTYPQPRGRHPFSITTEVSRCPWNVKHWIIHIGLQGKNINLDNVAPSNLTFLIDVSGSMQSYDKLPLLKSSLRMLVSHLREKDRISMVVYAGRAGLVLPSTPASNKKKIIEAIDCLTAGGCTAGGAGIQLAYKIAKENFIKNGNNRVILATDGDFNVGVSSDGELVRIIEEKRKAGIFLTVLGFGTGNYKDAKMEKLADKGNGNYAYIDNILEAKKVVVNEMAGTMYAIAKDVKIQIEFNPGKVTAYRLIGYENRKLQKEDFNDDTKDAGELGSGHTVTAMYEIIPAGVKADLPDVDDLKYQKTVINKENSTSDELLTIKFRYKEPDGEKSKLIKKVVKSRTVQLEKTSENFAFSVAVAGFGQLLRDSKYIGDLTYDKVLTMANSSIGRDTEGCRREFVKLVEKCKLMKEQG